METNRAVTPRPKPRCAMTVPDDGVPSNNLCYISADKTWIGASGLPGLTVSSFSLSASM